MKIRRTRSASPSAIAAFAASTMMMITASVEAGGTPENVLLIIDPTDADSLHVGNYYRQARNIPASNVLYMSSRAADYQTFVENQSAAFLGTLARRDLFDHIDYVVVAPGAPYRISANGYIDDRCAPVNHFAISSCYSMTFLSDRIFDGWQSTARNGYADVAGDPPIGFDSEIAWLDGAPSDDPDAQRLFLGALLGYTGDRGNTVGEILDMIDRSVDVDGTFPDGTFYYMETNDQARSGPRDGAYPRAVNRILDAGGQAEHRCCAALPNGEQDALGIMTGASSPDIDGADMTILPGAFCDHLTSHAGNFNTSSQVKMSRWIANGAVGSWGTVEEPCNYPGKFPHAFTHLQYFRGLSLGEAVLRNIGFVPFQGLLLGDPLTRPYTHIPDVSVPDAPVDPVAGIVRLTPEAVTSHPTAEIDSFDLLVDGTLWRNVPDGSSFNLDTTRFDDGWHEVRVIAYDDTAIRSAGRWIGSIEIDNHGQSTSIDQITPTAGDLATAFTVDATVDAGGAGVEEIRLMQYDRVVATASNDQTSLVVHGRMLGAGPSPLRVEALLSDGSIVSSAPATVDVSAEAGSPISDPPVAYDFTKRALSDETIVVELPATADDRDKTLTYTLISDPAQAVVHAADPEDPYRILTIDPGASGLDSLTFEVDDGTNASNRAVVTLEYEPCNLGRPRLEVSDLHAGEEGVFTVTCGYPNSRTFLAYSLRGGGATPVPALNVVLDLRQPRQAGDAKSTDADGFVDWSITIPNVPTPKRIFLQAAQRSAVSNLVIRDITQ